MSPVWRNLLIVLAIVSTFGAALHVTTGLDVGAALGLATLVVSGAVCPVSALTLAVTLLVSTTDIAKMQDERIKRVVEKVLAERKP